jgi:hypothetical protein
MRRYATALVLVLGLVVIAGCLSSIINNALEQIKAAWAGNQNVADYARQIASQVGLTGEDGTFSVEAAQEVLGNTQADCNPTDSGGSGSGNAAFRVCRLGGADAGARSTTTVEHRGLMCVVRPAVSVRGTDGDLDIGNTDFGFDEPNGGAQDGVPGARMTLQGVVNMGDPSYDTNPAGVQAEDGPIDDLSECEDIEVVSDGDGDMMMPPLPELPDNNDDAEFGYRFLLEGPPGSDFTPLLVDIPTFTGRITLADRTSTVEGFGTDRFNITDYYPLVPGSVYMYSELPTAFSPGGTWQLEVRAPVTNTLPDVGTFTAIPVQKFLNLTPTAYDATYLDWWLAESGDSGGLALYASTGTVDPTVPLGDAGTPNTMLTWTDPRLIFPNNLAVGEQVSYPTTFHSDAVHVSQADGTSPMVRCQIQSAGDEVTGSVGTYSDTLTVLWTIPQELSPGVVVDFAYLATLAKGVGVLMEEIYAIDPADATNRVLIYKSLIEDFDIPPDGGLSA